MCGIVSYLGPQDALPIIIAGLERLEYRGYDSAGVALFEGGKVNVTRAVGKLGELKKELSRHSRSEVAHIGIGHTRWATHGKPSETNAHPHTAGRVSLIHNGIIENYIKLRKELQARGSVFKSETDTEIAAHLLNYYLEQGQAPYQALKSVCKEIHGSYAFVAFDSKNPDRLLVAKNSTPIVIGMGQGEVIVASDIPAVLSHTREVLVLEDGDIAEVTVKGITIENGGKPVTRKTQTITWDPVTAQKGGFKHYMLKEIFDQPRAISDSLLGRIERENNRVVFPELGLGATELKRIKRIVFSACGTANYACLVGKYFVEKFARIPCEVDYASEFRYRDPVLDKDTLVVAVSQSGETADTLGAIELAGKSAMTLAICNVLGSSITRKVENVIFTHAGPEISVASTKAFTTQLTVLYLFALYLAQERTGAATSEQLLSDLIELPASIEEALKVDLEVQRIAKEYHQARDFLFLGRGMCYPVALEGALKLKEISYIHAEGYPAGEMKHGPIALIDEHMPVVVVLNRSDALFDKTVSNLREVESRGGKIIAVTDAEDLGELKLVCRSVLKIPYLSESLSPIISVIPLQLLAYHVAVLNGTDVDQPRNLAKSVTVE